MDHPESPTSIGHRYTSVYATPHGETHVRTIEVQLEPADFAPPAQPLLMAEAQAATNFFFLAAPCNWGESDLENGLPHPAPARLLCTILQGTIVTYASDGTSVQAGPGETLLLEDVAPSKGHITVNPSSEQRCLVHMIQLTG